MKYILYSLLLVTLLVSDVSAKITEKQLDRYMSVSRGGAQLKYMQNKSFYNIVDIYDLDLNNTTDPRGNGILDKLNDEEYVNLYTKEIKIKLNPKEYKKIMSFYTTKVGKKYANTLIKKFIFKEKKTDIKIHENFRKIIKVSPYSIVKKEFIYAIMNELDVLKIGMKSSEELEKNRQQFLSNIDSKNMIDTPTKVIKERSKKSYAFMKKWFVEVNMIYFQNFTEDELESVLQYVSSVGKIEYNLIVAGVNPYYIGVLKDIFNELHNQRREVNNKVLIRK